MPQRKDEMQWPTLRSNDIQKQPHSISLPYQRETKVKVAQVIINVEEI